MLEIFKAKFIEVSENTGIKKSLYFVEKKWQNQIKLKKLNN